MKFVIEHLEKRLYRWCLLEYSHISKIVGKNNLIFTNIKRKNRNLEQLGKVIKESIKDLKLNNFCILDPDAEKTLLPSDSEKFDYLIFGGILGDNPRRHRTKIELSGKLQAETRNLGKKQMSTDTAVYVAKKIIEGISIEDLNFIDNLEITIKEGKFNESLILPYRYIKDNGKLIFSDELMNYLKRKRTL